MKLGHIEMFVRDPMASLPFYRDLLDFELVEIQGERVVWLKSGEQLMLLRPGGGPEQTGRYADAGAAFVLYTDDLPATIERLERGGLVFDGNDGRGCPTFTDPDGHWFQLVNPADH